MDLAIIEPMETFRDIIDQWGTQASLARRFDIAPGTVAQWYRRDRIPAHWWHRVAFAAKEASIDGVTLELMALIEDRRRLPK